jgi:RNA polymerase sigma-70 factor (ECF subfamily)
VNSESDDATLVSGTLAGDEQAFEQLVRRYRRACLACALAHVGDLADAEDVVQDALVRAHEQLLLLRDPTRVGGWLMMIVRRTALNAVRTKRRRRTVPLDAALPSKTRHAPDYRVNGADARDVLLRALAQLTPLQREVVLLADLEHCPHARIAELLEISVLMSRRHLSDARRVLRGLLSPPGA